jgi:hypothetical protein
MYLFKSFDIAQVRIKLCPLPDGYGFHLTIHQCTVYEYVECGKVFCLNHHRHHHHHYHPMHPV